MEFCIGSNFRNVTHSNKPDEFDWDTVVMSRSEFANLHVQIRKLSSDLEAQRGINENLIRISRERANSERELRPKRDHTGYVVLSSSERDIIYRINDVSQTALVWETVLQTPYRVDLFTADQAKSQVEFELCKKQDPIAALIGIRWYFPNGYISVKNDVSSNPDLAMENILFSMKYKANYRSNYWEIVIQHTKQLQLVPEEMRIVKNKDK